MGSQPFPQQLMKILFRSEYEDVISWSTDGRCFTIHDKENLIRIFSECYFQDTKYESFRRKLHRWGFKTMKKGTNAGAYYHKFFIRDNPSLCSNMKCKKQNSGVKTQLKLNSSLRRKYDSSSSQSEVQNIHESQRKGLCEVTEMDEINCKKDKSFIKSELKFRRTTG